MRTLPLLVLLAACGTEAPEATAPEAAAPEAAAHEAAAPEAASHEAAATETVAKADGWSHFGDPFTVETAVAASTFFADPEAHVGKTVRVEGEAADVCQKKGCWLVLADGENSMRIFTKDHAFGIDTNSKGATVDIEGIVEKSVLDPKAAEHYAGEASDPAAAPKGEGAEATYSIVASGISVKAPQG